MAEPLTAGSVVWVDFDPVQGREQAGTRPAVVIASDAYLEAVPDLVVVVPVTSRDRGWPHHVPLAGRRLGIDRASFAMTEQPRTISRSRISRVSGKVDGATSTAIAAWIKDFLDLYPPEFTLTAVPPARIRAAMPSAASTTR